MRKKEMISFVAMSTVLFSFFLAGCVVPARTVRPAVVPPPAAHQVKGYKNEGLPPGLQKKAARGKPLPPGWHKKLSAGDILDNSIYLRGRVVVPLGADGTVSINIDGVVIKLYENTRRIISISN